MKILPTTVWVPDAEAKCGAEEFYVEDLVIEETIDHLTCEKKKQKLYKCVSVSDSKTIYHYHVDGVFLTRKEAQRVMYKHLFRLFYHTRKDFKILLKRSWNMLSSCVKIFFRSLV